jgi:two-component system, chemotaxis family, chemotaxis protein CheY
MKILIVDDSQFMRGVLRGILEKGEYEVIEAQNGKQGMEMNEQEKPDLILLDIIMPEMDGIDVLKKIGKQAKIIVISAIGQDKMVDEAKELGAIDYIVKPFDNEKVLETVQKVVS